MKTSLFLSILFSAFIHAADKPNILVFLVDDLGYMDIGVNNPNGLYETPHIDTFAKEAMLFTDGYASCSVCSPSRVSMLTGKYPIRVKTTHLFPGRKGNPGRSGKFRPAPFLDELPLEEITLAEALKTKGYATFFAGKWHLGYGPDFRPQKQGFDINIGGYDRGGPYSGKGYFAPFKNPEIKKESPTGEHLPHRLAKDTAQFIKNSGDEPFFAYLSFYSVHTPLMGRKDLIEKYDDKLELQGIKPTKKNDYKNKEIFGTLTGANNANKPLRLHQTHSTYAAMVDAMDSAVGLVLQAVKDAGQWENTIIVFTSDNGGLSTSEGLPTSNLPLKGGKGWMYEGGIREPWIIHYPSVTTPGSVSDTPISGIDLFPTIAAAVGYEQSEQSDGVDLKPLLAGQKLHRDALYWHYPHYSNQGGIPAGVIREGDYKLILNYETGISSLYNLRDDIGETKDLASFMPEKTKAMKAKLYTHLQKHDAAFLQDKGDNKAWRPSY